MEPSSTFHFASNRFRTPAFTIRRALLTTTSAIISLNKVVFPVPGGPLIPIKPEPSLNPEPSLHPKPSLNPDNVIFKAACWALYSPDNGSEGHRPGDIDPGCIFSNNTLC